VLEAASRSLANNGGFVTLDHASRTDAGERTMSTLQGANVLVTGGAGTIGSTLVDQLLDAGVGPRRRAGQPGARPPGEPGRRLRRPA
jgi:predicted glycosyltransferase